MQILREAEEQWQQKQKNQLEEQSSGTQTMEQLREEVADLQTQLELVRHEQAALMKAELAAAKATWNRDKRQELCGVQDGVEKAYESKLLEQRRKLERALQQQRQEAASQQKELLLQMEARMQQTLVTREEEWKRQASAKEETRRQQTRGEMLAELQAALADVQEQFQRDLRTDQQQDSEDIGTKSGAASEHTVTQIIKMSCRDIVDAAVSRAKEGWKRVSLCWVMSAHRFSSRHMKGSDD